MKCAICEKEFEELTNEVIFIVNDGNEVSRDICEGCAKKLIGAGDLIGAVSLDLEKKFGIGETNGIRIVSKKK